MNNNQIEIKKFITPDVKKQMTKWEREYISSIYKQEKPWTEKQVAVWEKIKIKYQLFERVVVEKIIYLPTGYAQGAKVNQSITSRLYRKNRNKENRYGKK